MEEYTENRNQMDHGKNTGSGEIEIKDSYWR